MDVNRGKSQSSKNGGYLVTIKSLRAKMAFIPQMGAVLCLPWLMVACSGSGNGTLDNKVPEVQLDFPAPFGMIESDTVFVRGRASDSSGIDSLTVNGVIAKSNDGFANWSADVPLNKPGDYRFDVSAQDTAGNKAQQVALAELRSIPAQIDFKRSIAIAIDPSNNSAFWLVQDNSITMIVKVDLESGDRALVSRACGSNAVGCKPVGSGDISFGRPTDMVLDGKGFAWIVDEGVDALIKVDLSNGSRTLISSNNPGDSPVFKEPRGVALESPQYALVADTGTKALLRVDLETGERSLASQFHSVGDGPKIRPLGVVLGETGFAYITSETNLIRINLGNGDREVVSSTASVDPVGEGPSFAYSRNMAFDDDGFVYVTSVTDGDSKLLKVNLDNGNRITLSGGQEGSGVPFGGLSDMVLDGQGFAWMTGSTPTALYKVNLATGERALSIDQRYKIGQGILFENLEDVYLDSQNQAWVTDDTLDALLKVDLSNGDRTVVSDASHGIGDIAFVSPLGVVLDKAGFAWVIDHDLDALIKVDPDNGDRTVISRSCDSEGNTDDCEPVGSGDAFDFPIAVALEGADTAWVLETGLEALVKVDVSTGDREVFSQFNLSESDGVNYRPRDIVLDGKGFAWIVDNTVDALIKVNLNNRVNTVVSRTCLADGNTTDCESVGEGEVSFDYPIAVALDGAGFAWVVDSALDALIKVDINSGKRTIVSDNLTPKGGLRLNDLKGMTIDAERKLAWVVGGSTQELIAIDLKTGQRVSVSR